MESFVIEGGRKLQGSIRPMGNKNAALALFAACLLTDQEVVLHNIPQVGDVQSQIDLLRRLGAVVEHRGEHTWSISCSRLAHSKLDSDLVSQLSAALLLVGPLLARFGSVTIPKRGSSTRWRKILAIHLRALKQLGVHVEEVPEGYLLQVNRFRGADIFLSEMSVTATEQAIMAAVRAEGVTVISNAASEPHVQDLCNFLNMQGAHIKGVGSNVLEIQGTSDLKGGEFKIGPDYIEVASFISLAAVTGSEFRIVNARPQDHRMNRIVFQRLGVMWHDEGEDIVVPSGQQLQITESVNAVLPKIDCEPWPGFATDLISVAVVVATQAKGDVIFNEKMYGDRLIFVDRLIDMGASIVQCDPYRVIVTGPSRLTGIDSIPSPDIRAGLAMVVAALCAQGRTVLQNVRQIDRGFERIEERLAELGAYIQRRY